MVLRSNENLNTEEYFSPTKISLINDFTKDIGEENCFQVSRWLMKYEF
jgi:hypothetical protein